MKWSEREAGGLWNTLGKNSEEQAFSLYVVKVNERKFASPRRTVFVPHQNDLCWRHLVV